MLGGAIGDLLPSAFAVALSPIPIVAVVLVLGSHHARTAGPAFALGWVAGLLGVSVIVVLVLGGGSDAEETGVNWLKVAIGVLFLLMAAKQWQKRPKNGQEPETPSWMSSMDAASPSRAALIGATLSGANPKNLALTLAGAVLFYLVDAERAAGPLDTVKRFMSDNNAVIMMVVLLLLGAKLLGDGLAGVWP